MTKVLFIHHSTGANLIHDGNLRAHLQKLDPSIEFWDHNYNLYPNIPKILSYITYHTGLSDASGKPTGSDYNIILSNNSPKEYAKIFSRNPQDPTLKSILSYDMIAFKNCYPTTKITTDTQLQTYIKYYKSIRDHVKQYTNKQFILLTPPPLRKEGTTAENAKRAKELARVLTSPEFSKGVPNFHVFNFFGLLADTDGFLKREYCRFITIDSHPNKAANREVAPIFAKYIVEFTRSLS